MIFQAQILDEFRQSLLMLEETRPGVIDRLLRNGLINIYGRS